MPEPIFKVPVYRKVVGGPWSPTLPERGTTHARGFDVRAFLPDGPVTIRPLQTVIIPTGLFMALPQGSAVMVCSRSGLASKGVVVTNAPGIIDSDYRGECNVILTYLQIPATMVRLGPNINPTESFVINHGDRIAQWVYLPSNTPDYSGQPEFVEVASMDDLPDPNSDRKGGFGSTGVA